MLFSLSWEQWVLGFSLTLPRLLSAFALMPFFSNQMMPGLLRTGVAVGLGLVMVPFVATQATAMPLAGMTLFIVILKEMILGLLIGYPIAAAFWAIESVGEYIDNQRGSAMASSVDPLSASETTPFGILFTQAFTTYFLTSGAFLLLLGVFYQTYQIWPVPSFYPNLGAVGPDFYLHTFDRMMSLVILLSAPIIIAMFLVELALGLISRFAPQLNVFFLAMPIKSALAVLMMIFYGPILFGDVMAHDGGSESIWRALRAALQ